jgi:hypothetical protein
MRTRIAGFLLWTLFASGCGRDDRAMMDDEFDAALARQTLFDALDSWKQGQPQRLAAGAPPIRFEDDDWAAGWRLMEYRLSEPTRPIRPFENVGVTLTLQRESHRVERTAAYQVSLSPQRAVLRGD